MISNIALLIGAVCFLVVGVMSGDFKNGIVMFLLAICNLLLFWS